MRNLLSHLYNGGDPDSYITDLHTIANNYPDKTIWQTEFDWPTPFNSAWLIHNMIVEGRASGPFGGFRGRLKNRSSLIYRDINLRHAQSIHIFD